MKKLVSFIAVVATLAFFTGCNDMDTPTPLDTRAGASQTGGAGNGMPTSVYGDDLNALNGLNERGAGFDGRNMESLDNPRPEDLIATIYFGFDQFAVEQGERAKLSAAAKELSANGSLKVFLVAHTDWYGTEEYNLALSDKRGAAVLSYLASLGIPVERAEIIARGKTTATPDVAKNSPQAKHDRRVDIIRIK